MNETVNVLTIGPLHRVMLFFHIPATWSSWLVALVIIPLVGLPAIIWWLFAGGIGALIVALIMATFILLDAISLYTLPKQNISYGPWQSQLLALTIPRIAIAFLAVILVPLVGMPTALALLLAFQLVGTIALFYGTRIEPLRLRMTRRDIVFAGLPRGSKPIRLLHISDIHLERITQRERMLQRLVYETDPELILLTGDYLNLSYVHDPESHRQLLDLLRSFSAKYGIYASLGSPTVDDRELIPALFEELPIKWLVDQWTEVNLGDDRRLILLGVDCSHHLPTDRRRFDQLLATAPNTAPRILLYHSPELMPEATEHEIDLYLCGHTHGGQVRLPGYGAILTSSQYGKRYEMGHYTSGRTHLYVSRGLGLEGLSAPRVRFLSPPEITLFTLLPQ